MQAGRDGIWSHSSGSSCNYEDVGQWTLFGTQSVEVQEITADVLQLVASPVIMKRETLATFTPSLVSGQPIGSTINWRWTPDGASDATVACGTNANPCKSKVYSSGTMRVVSYINGRMRQAKAHVIVYSEFTLEADKRVINASDSVVFTPFLDNDTTDAPHWKWVPDDPNGTDTTTCANTRRCVMRVTSSGTMKAYLSSDESSEPATKHVTALTPCPTGDPLLDDPEVRDWMQYIWSASVKDPNTGNLLPVPDRKEVSMVVYRSTVDGRYSFNYITLGDPCGADLPGSIPKTKGNSVAVAIIHDHVLEWGGEYPSNCEPPKDPGATYSDLFHNSEIFKHGRASGDDWNSSKLLEVPGYVFDFDGIYRYDGTKVRIMPMSVSGGGTEYWVQPGWKDFYQEWPLVGLAGCKRP